VTTHRKRQFLRSLVQQRLAIGGILAALGILGFNLWSAARAADPPSPSLADQAYAILSQNCFKCHGPSKQNSDLRLDVREIALRGGSGDANVIVPGKSAESEMIKRVTTDTELERMPAEGNPLTSQQVDTLKKWIDAGAEYPKSPSTAPATQPKN
jgi:mono/diheme cytochrome c family protein